IAFARAGARLELGARRLDRLGAVAERCRAAGSPAVNVRLLDVGERASARTFIAAAKRDHERLDILVNNAGVGWRGALHEMPEEKVDELIATNLKGVINTTQSVLPWMLERRRGWRTSSCAQHATQGGTQWFFRSASPISRSPSSAA